jgi:hypothetical protein
MRVCSASNKEPIGSDCLVHLLMVMSGAAMLVVIRMCCGIGVSVLALSRPKEFAAGACSECGMHVQSSRLFLSIVGYLEALKLRATSRRSAAQY